MTYEEALEFANCLKHNYTIDFNDIKPFCDLAIEALQKQVPMKPKAEDFGWTVRENCPVCDDSVDCGEIYCSYCGQRIDRNDE